MQDIDFTESKIIILCGPPKRGKTNMIKYLILKNSVDRKIFNFGLVFCRTKFNNKDYTYIPDKYIIGGYDENILRKFIDNLEKLIKEKKKFSAFLVFDDLIGILNRNDPFLINLWSIHRHLNLTIFIATQHLKGSSTNTVFREVTNNGIFFRTNREDTIRAIYKEFGTNGFDKYVDFKNHFMKCTSEPFTGMYYDSSSDKENYYCIRSVDMTEFKIKLNY